MDDAMSLLFDLPGLWVVSCEEMPPDGRRVVVMQRAAEHGCPRCAVLAGGKPYDVREMRVKDVPMGHRPLEVVWRKRATAAASRVPAAGIHRAVGADPAASPPHAAPAGPAGGDGVAVGAGDVRRRARLRRVRLLQPGELQTSHRLALARLLRLGHKV